jgi:hypothetical protein
MSDLSIVNSDGALTPDSEARILKHTEILECACPQHLLAVVSAIRAFQEYETGCIIRYPKDQEIHSWLLEESKKMEMIATKTIVELMQKEGIIDENHLFCVPPKFEKA